MDFFLFILVNAALFIRPPEVFPGLQDFQLYLYLIIPCLVLAVPSVLEQLRGGTLAARPITVCVLGLLLAVVLSNLSQLDLGATAREGVDFTKVVVYYLLLVSVVNTPDRLRRFLYWLAAFSAVVGLFAVLEYHQLITLPTLTTLEERTEVVPGSGEGVVFRRLRGTGIFADPNDFTQLLVLALPICCYGLSDRRLGLARLLWLGPLGLFGHALLLTQSRGGFLSFLAGVLAFLYVRYGWRKCLALGAVTLPLFFVLFAGRMTDLGTGSGTSQERIRLWSDALAHFKSAPAFGIGMNKYTELNELVPHNSFLHAYTELGFLGGTLFLGAVVLSGWLLLRLGRERRTFLDPEMRRLQPFLLAVVMGSLVGMLSLSRCYIVTTYTVFGLTAAYLRVTAVWPPLPPLRFDTRLVQRLALTSTCFLGTMYVFVRLFVHRL